MCIEFCDLRILWPYQKQRRLMYELSCQQMYRMHCQAVRLPLRRCQLLLPGSHHRGHPRGKSFHGPVHRLQVLSQKVKNDTRRRLPPHFFLTQRPLYIIVIPYYPCCKKNLQKIHTFLLFFDYNIPIQTEGGSHYGYL